MNFKRFILTTIFIVNVVFANNINLNELVLEAKKTNKHILVFLHITGCDYCLRMQEFTFDDERVQSAIKKDFIFVDINVRSKGVVSFDDFNATKMQFAKESGYPMYPSCLFYDKNGELVYDVVGYKDEDRLLKALKVVANKSYDDIEQN